ncbi:probable E3 ubiquitin-protein ligase ari2 [Phtheirospermum japonicum]|uniref:RBR-type E3 ubiquitin transferase n=1 Tax=Phtheirospermum japonicum TaxID=374723 RepID=A0A830D0R9_9LAMI|nr:probable E3 ubiquitin-protein ligase ari2 [Phtheirospermum japonicum]
MEEDYGYGSSDDEFHDRVYDDDVGDEGFQEPDDESDFFRYSRASSCKVIRKESLLAAQKDDLQRVMELLTLKEHHARTLLIHYRWDADKVLMVFVEKGKESLYSEAGISVVENNNLSSSRFSSEISCEICFEQFPATETTIMDCGHCFCNECWTEHFVVQINEGKSRRISCMAHKCYSICNEEYIRNLVSARDPQLAEKFDRYLLESYIEDNKKVKWCPSIPHCGNAVRVEDDEYCEVECACGLQFCFSCSSEAHSPCSCPMWEFWVRKCEVESENIKWITENTKYCPKCHKPVDKNGGCNLVQCICGQPFCWLCGGATGIAHTLTSIENHSCGRYKEEHGDALERKRKEVWRYTHYYNRYKAHLDSLKAEEKLNAKLQQETDVLASRDLEATKDNSWVSDAFYRLAKSRCILLYSYPFAYFMFGDELFKNEMSLQEKVIKQNLFEDQQQQLETNIERLSMCLEEQFAGFSEDRLLEIRMKIVNLSAVTDNLCRKLYDCIENELLGPLEQATHIIAPYRSKGVNKASELHDSLFAEADVEDKGINYKGRFLVRVPRRGN